MVLFCTNFCTNFRVRLFPTSTVTGIFRRRFELDGLLPRGLSKEGPGLISTSFGLPTRPGLPASPACLPVRPVKLAAPLLQLELLRRERAPGENDGDHVLAIEIRAHDRAIIPFGITHIGPVDVPSGDIERQAIGQLPASADNVFKSEPSGFADRMRPPRRSRKKSLPGVAALFACAFMGVEAIELM